MYRVPLRPNNLAEAKEQMRKRDYRTHPEPPEPEVLPEVQQPTNGHSKFDAATFIREKLSVKTEEAYKDGIKSPLNVCPFNADHVDGSAVAGVLANGAGWFKCSHNSCDGRDWKDMRALLDPEYAARQVGLNGPAVDISGITETLEPSDTEADEPTTIGEMMNVYGEMRPAVLQGFLREGETMNLIAAPKMGKSWLVYDLCLAVVTGGKWVGEFQAVQGNVLLIDNELHPETIANRIPRVAEALTIDRAAYENALCVESLRGRLRDINSLNGYFSRFKPGRFKLVVIDAWYRALPKDTDENANGDMTAIYNTLDSYALKLGCAFVLVHHASKGNQSEKSVTDTGSGAGAQSRAADTHLVLRAHEENDVVVLDAATRSWPTIKPTCLRWQFPAWEVAPDLDPTLLRKARPRRTADGNKDAPAKAPEWTPERFVGQFCAETPVAKLAIIDAAIKGGLSDRKATDLFGRAVAIKLLHDHGGREFATTPPPAPPEGEPSAPSATFFKRDAVIAEIDKNPSASNREIGKLCEVSHTYVARIRKEVAQ